MISVVKKDGTKEDFNVQKVVVAVNKSAYRALVTFTDEELDFLLKALSETEGYGTILRSKGIIPMTDGTWKQFDLVPEEYEVREGRADYTGRVCVIGTDLKEEELRKLFHI